MLVVERRERVHISSPPANEAGRGFSTPQQLRATNDGDERVSIEDLERLFPCGRCSVCNSVGEFWESRSVTYGRVDLVDAESGIQVS